MDRVSVYSVQAFTCLTLFQNGHGPYIPSLSTLQCRGIHAGSDISDGVPQVTGGDLSHTTVLFNFVSGLHVKTLLHNLEPETLSIRRLTVLFAMCPDLMFPKVTHKPVHCICNIVFCDSYHRDNNVREAQDNGGVLS
jgi:hypothetical protein